MFGLFKKKKKVIKKGCSHRKIMRRFHRDENGLFFARYCLQCEDVIQRLKLSDAPKDYIELECKSGFITLEEAKECIQAGWLKGVMSYNIHVDG